MKKTIIICLSFLVLSCSVKKNNTDPDTTSQIINKNNLTEIEVTIVNDFLEKELIKDRYKPYKDYPICIIKEELGKLYSLKIYEYCYSERNSLVKNSTNKDWILNESQIKKIQKDLTSNENYYWKVSDFKTFNVSIIESSEVRKSIKENTYIKLPKRLLIYLSTPLVIDKENAFISLSLGDSSLGFTTINRFTALLNKNQEGKWEIDSYYYDPNSSW